MGSFGFGFGLGLKPRAPSGGGGEPEWLIEADFKNGVYRLDGELVTLDDIFDTVEDWSPEPYATPTAGVGYYQQGEQFAVFSAAARALLPAGGTYLFDVTIISNEGVDSYIQVDMTDLPTFSNEFEFNVRNTEILVSTAGEGETAGTSVDPPFANGAHKFASTVSTTHIACCADGGTVYSHSATETTPATHVGFTFASPVWKIEAMRVAAPQADAVLAVITA